MKGETDPTSVKLLKYIFVTESDGFFLDFMQMSNLMFFGFNANVGF